MSDKNFRDYFSTGGQYYSNPLAYKKYEEKYNLPSGLLYNVARTESAFNPNAKSPVGATGLMQFMPPTAREYGINPLDPEQSIDAAGKYLSKLIKQTGSVEDGLRAYNWGIGNMDRFKKGEIKNMPKETRDYVGKVLGTGTAPSLSLSTSSLGKYFNQIEQDLSWRSKQIDEELEDEAIPQYTQQESIAENDINDEEEDVNNETEKATEDEYLPLEEMSKLITASRRNDFLDIIFSNTDNTMGDEYYSYI